MNASANNRRGFFREAFTRLMREVATRTEQRVAPRRYFRPPGAADEIAFLASCTRCGDCLPVCPVRSEEHTSELQSPCNLVCRLLLEKKKKTAVLSVALPKPTVCIHNTYSGIDPS